VLVFPKGLNGFYYTPIVHNLGFTRFVLPLAVLGAVVVLVWWWSKREHDPLIAFFGLWIPVCLIPVLYLPTFRPGDFVRDRYVYLSSIGFAFLLAKVIRQLHVGEKKQERASLQAVVVVSLLLAFTVGVLTQQIYWADDFLVFYRGYSLSPQNTRAATYLAAELNWRGDPVSAQPLLKQSIAAEPTDFYSHWTLALVDSELHRDQEARQELATAVNLAPEYYRQTRDGLTNYGIALATLHEYDQAENRLRRAVQLEPNATSALLYLGLVLLRTNRPEEAAIYLNKAALIYPEGYNIHFALGLLAQVRGDRAQAEAQYRAELQFHPDNSKAKMGLAALLKMN
jgi:Tfp pilus assembly protein PilF